MAYRGFKILFLRTASDKVFSDKRFNIAKNSKYTGYKQGLGSMVYKFFNKRSSCGAITCSNKSAIKSEIILNYHLAKELHKLVIRKVFSSFKDNI